MGSHARPNRTLVLGAYVATARDALRDAADMADRHGRPGLASVMREFAEQTRRCAERSVCRCSDCAKWRLRPRGEALS